MMPTQNTILVASPKLSHWLMVVATLYLLTRVLDIFLKAEEAHWGP